ncbi:MAG TPA: SRPBCC family protein [Flexivirga sp.]|uniref:SRPBCC family protein n=1 Tax=Flexivirga sp. TaxID=1962927 RepID=UPI002C67811C|nr:SRPBCC family protein [Flexivirga sp.]HWC23044.1 SRPBCC family protein [Flexivirga sp.]
MTTPEETKVVSATRDIAAPAAQIFELIADPSRQPAWDGNHNLEQAAAGQRVRAVGEVFRMTLANGKVRDNKVVEFEEGRRIAWCPGNEGAAPAGHLWRWELAPLDDQHTRVTHTYDWSRLNDPKRVDRARSTTSDNLSASLEKLAATVESA